MTSAAVRRTILAAEKAFVSAYNAKDANALVAMYARDAEIMAPKMKTASGPRALAALFRTFWKAGDVNMKLATVEIEGAGDYAYEVGTYKLFRRSGRMSDHGKYVVVWKRVRGRWKLYRDIFNSDP